MAFHHHQLNNGLTILGETNPSALSLAMGFWVRTGSRDETSEVSGVSHFLEHMIFKGTERRDSFTVNRDFSRIGADNNAWTSEENTFYHAVVLPEYLPALVDVLADIMRPSLREEDFNTEKSVILDEIVRYQVQPGWAAYDHARKTFYGNHPLGNSVLGTTESITALTRNQMMNYYNARYLASNIHLVVAGNFDFSSFVELIDQACGKWPTGKVERLNRTEVNGAGGIHIVEKPEEKVSQEYLMMISPGPAANSPLRYAASVLATAIGDYAGSRLYWALTDPGYADECGMGADECDGAGAYYLSLNCNPDNIKKCYQIVTELYKIVQDKGLSEEEIDQAKTKIASREVRASERTHRRMLQIAKDWAYLGEYRNLDDELAAIEAVNLKSIREVLDAYPLSNYTTTAFGPCSAII